MPISREQFEQGMTNEVLHCIEALRAFFSRGENADIAYSEQDLLGAVKRQNEDLTILVGYPRGEEPDWAKGQGKAEPGAGAAASPVGRARSEPEPGIRVPVPPMPYDRNTMKAALKNLVQSGFLASTTVVGQQHYIVARDEGERH